MAGYTLRWQHIYLLVLCCASVTGDASTAPNYPPRLAPAGSSLEAIHSNTAPIDSNYIHTLQTTSTGSSSFDNTTGTPGRGPGRPPANWGGDDCYDTCRYLQDICWEGPDEARAVSKPCSPMWYSFTITLAIEVVVAVVFLVMGVRQAYAVYREVKGASNLKLWANFLIVALAFFKLVHQILNLVEVATWGPSRSRLKPQYQVWALEFAITVAAATENTLIMVQIMNVLHFWINLVTLMKQMSSASFLVRHRSACFILIGIFMIIVEYGYRIYKHFTVRLNGGVLLLPYNVAIITVAICLAAGTIYVSRLISKNTAQGREARRRTLQRQESSFSDIEAVKQGMNNKSVNRTRTEYATKIRKFVYTVIIGAWFIVLISFIRVVLDMTIGERWAVYYAYVVVADITKFLFIYILLRLLKPLTKAQGYAMTGGGHSRTRSDNYSTVSSARGSRIMTPREQSPIQLSNSNSNTNSNDTTTTTTVHNTQDRQDSLNKSTDQLLGAGAWNSLEPSPSPPTTLDSGTHGPNGGVSASASIPPRVRDSVINTPADPFPVPDHPPPPPPPVHKGGALVGRLSLFRTSSPGPRPTRAAPRPPRPQPGPTQTPVTPSPPPPPPPPPVPTPVPAACTGASSVYGGGYDDGDDGLGFDSLSMGNGGGDDGLGRKIQPLDMGDVNMTSLPDDGLDMEL